MKLIYSLINRSSKAEGILEFKIEIDKQEYALIKCFEYRDNVISYILEENGLLASNNFEVNDSKFNKKIVSIKLTSGIFEKIEKEDIWQSPLFVIEYRSLDHLPSQLFENFKKQIVDLMAGLKSRVQSADELRWEESVQLTY